MKSKSKIKKLLSSHFLGLLSITLLILTFSSNTWAGTAYFWVHAKSSIERLDPHSPPPGSLGLNATEYQTQHGNIRDGCWICAPAPFDETPNMSTPWGAQEPSEEYRLYGEFRIKVTCNGSTMQSVTIDDIFDKGGCESEVGGICIISGIVDMDPLLVPLGGRADVSYVLSGQPDPTIEAAAFTPVKARGNKKIWQKGRVNLYCSSSGTPSAWLSTSSSYWKGSAFPTHNVSLWNGNSSGLTGSSPRQTLQKNQGKFWELWDLDSVPSP